MLLILQTLVFIYHIAEQSKFTNIHLWGLKLKESANCNRKWICIHKASDKEETIVRSCSEHRSDLRKLKVIPSVFRFSNSTALIWHFPVSVLLINSLIVIVRENKQKSFDSRTCTPSKSGRNSEHMKEDPAYAASMWSQTWASRHTGPISINLSNAQVGVVPRVATT